MNQPTYESLLQDLGYKTLPNRVEELYDMWLKTKRLWVMTETEITWLSKILELDDHTTEVLIKSVQTILNSEHLTSLFSFLQYVMIIEAHPSDWLIKEAPQIKHTEISIPVFQLLTILSLVPIAKRDYEKRNIDSEHMMFNLNHLKGYIKNYREKHQGIGIENFGWTTYLASLGLIHLSSLHFMHHVYTDRFIFFRNIFSHEITALALANINVRKDRQFDNVNQIQNLDFSTNYRETDDSYEGYTMNPMGSFRSTLIKLSKKEYEVILKPGDFVIDFHIPTKSDYSIEGFKKSLELS